MDKSRHQIVRALLVWLVASAGCAGLGTLAAPSARDAAAVAWQRGAAEADFVQLLGSLCGAVGVVCAGWLWVVTSVVVCSALAGRPWTTVPGCPEALRRLVLVGCGLALAGSVASPALAEGSTTDPVGHAGHEPSGREALVLRGLPLPERAESVRLAAVRPGSTPVGAEQPLSRRVVVRAGDSLWSISRRRLGPGATVGQLDASWRAIYALNRSTIGPDPDLVHPGQRLLLPPGLAGGPPDHTAR